MGKPVPEGDETLSEINCLRADLDEAIRVIKDFDDLRLATIREFGHANGLDGDPKYITAAAFLARMKGETK
jgi:hypothetical protein